MVIRHTWKRNCVSYPRPEGTGFYGSTDKPEHDEIVAMSCYTMCYHIADNFRDGEFRTEILEHFGVE